MTSRSDDPIVLRDLPVIRAATLPPNEKQKDYLLGKTEMTRSECDLLIRCLDNYAVDKAVDTN